MAAVTRQQTVDEGRTIDVVSGVSDCTWCHQYGLGLRLGVRHEAQTPSIDSSPRVRGPSALDLRQYNKGLGFRV